MIHLHINRLFVHDMWCGLKCLAMPDGDKYTFDIAKVDCPHCLEKIQKAQAEELEYAKLITEQERKNAP